MSVTEIIREAHIGSNIEFPLDVIPVTGKTEQAQLIRRRNGALSGVRWKIAEEMSHEYGGHSDHALSAVILAMIGPHLDAISVSQLQHIEEGPYTWEAIDPENTRMLRREIQKIRNSGSLSSYLSRNSEVDLTFEITEEIAINRDPEALFNYQQRLERLGKHQYNRNVPTIVAVQSPESLFPDAPIRKPPILIPDWRHVYSDSKTRDTYRQEASHVLSELRLPQDWIDHFIIGDMSAATGNSTYWTASGENLYSEGIILFLNVMEGHAKHFLKFCEYFGEDVKSFTQLYKYIFLLHELGHNLFPTEVGEFEEFAVNGHIAAFVFNRILREPDSNKQKALFAGFIYQNSHLMNFKTSDEYLDGYNLSNAIIMNTLTDCGILGADANGVLVWSIDRDRFMKASAKLWHLADMAVAAKIGDPNNDTFHIRWSEEALRVCRAIDKTVGL